MAVTFSHQRSSLRHDALRWPAGAFKRAIDVVGAIVLLVLAAPLLVVVAALIALTSGRPVLFRQERVGRGGQPFTMLKFRTMSDGNDDVHRELNRRELAGEATDGHKDHLDARITPIGRWLRHASIDELPQLLNVLAGEMSLVGPRPALPWEVELFEARHRRREAVRPGITGLWQVSGRNELTMLQMLELDMRYVDRRSTWGDLRILARTPVVVLRREGAG